MVIFYSSFETGDLTEWSDTSINGTTFGADNTNPHHGTYACKIAVFPLFF